MPSWGAGVLGLLACVALTPRPAHAAIDMSDARPVNLSPGYRTRVHRALGFVRGITQTSDGYLWFGTSFGLAKYDGEHFTFFDSSNTPAFSNDHLVGLLKSRDGALWMAGERGGVVRLVDGRFTAFPLPKEYSGIPLCCLAEDAHGVIWLAADTEGLFSLDNAQWRRYTRDDGLPAQAIQNLWRTVEGDVLVDLADGWARIHDGRISAVDPAALGFASETAFLLSEALPPVVQQTLAAQLPAIHDQQLAFLHVARDGSVWAGGNGVTHITSNGVSQYGYSEGLASIRVYAAHEDHEGNVWIGHYGTGVTQMTRPPFATVNMATGLGGGAAFSVVQTPDDNVWISGSGFLSLIRDNQIKNWRSTPAFPFWGTRSLAAGRDNRVFISTTHPEILAFDGERVETFPLPEPRPDGEFATAIFIDDAGVLWGGSSHGGLLRLSQGDRALSRMATPDIGPSGCRGTVTQDYPCPHAINIITARRQGGLWLGTHGQGVYFRDGERKIARLAVAGLDEASVFALHEDASHLYIGTDRGLFRIALADGHAVRFGRQHGLVSDMVFQILEDGRGHLWMGCERGIFYLEKSALAALADGRSDRLDPVSYRAIDGIPSDEVIRRFEPHGMRDRQGRLWFATVAGLAIFAPPENQPAAPQPRDPLLESALLKRIAFSPPLPAGPIEIPPGAGDLEFKYTSPGFVGPHRLQFHYRLDGFDRDWVDAGTRRAAFYTNIPPGDYVFRIRAHSAEGGSSRDITALSFRLRPQFHETATFYGLLAVLAVLIAIAIQRFRIGQLKARYAAVEAERTRIARDLHDTLAQVFSAMGFQLDSAMGLASGGSPVLKDRLRRVRQMVGHARLAARNVILNLRPSRSEGPPGRSLQTMLEAIPPVYDTANVQVTVSGDPKPLAALVENELFHIAQEAVSNAIEHGKAQLVSIELEYGPDKIELWIHDNGVGFEPADRADTHEPRFGLSGMRERATRAGATLTVHAEPDVGTEVGVVVALPGTRTAG